MIIDYVDNKWTFNAEEAGAVIPKFASTSFIIWWGKYFISKILTSEIELYDRFCISRIGDITCNLRYCYKESVSSLIASVDRVGGAIGVTALFFAATGVVAIAARRVSYLKEVAVAKEKRRMLANLIQQGVVSITPQELASMTDRAVSAALVQAVATDGIRLHNYSNAQNVGSWN